MSPSKKSVHRLKTKVANLLTPVHNEPWWEVRDTLNRSLRGWSNDFAYGTSRPAFRGMDQYVTERVRAFLARRHKVHGPGNRRFTYDVIHGERGVLALDEDWLRILPPREPDVNTWHSSQFRVSGGVMIVTDPGPAYWTLC